MTKAYDIIVIGLGAVGSATLYHCAQRRVQVLGIDRFTPPHTYGSTHGDTRVIRQAIGEGPHYTQFALRSFALWEAMQEQTAEPLLERVGMLVLSPMQSGGKIHGSDFFDNTVAAAWQYQIPHELLDAAAIQNRFPQFAITDETRGYYEPGAGFAYPERCVRTQLALAQRNGAEVHCDEIVQQILPTATSVHVVTNRGTYDAAHVVVSAGPWLPQLLPNYARYFSVTRQVLYWFDIRDAYEVFTKDRFPVFIWEHPECAEPIYGFPAIHGADGGLKIATEYPDAVTTADTVQREVSPQEIATMYEQRVVQYLPRVGSRSVKAITCLYTTTSDYGFVVDRLPDAPNVLLASPCSGHGFKHSIAIGEAITQWMVDGQSQIDLGPFALERFF